MIDNSDSLLIPSFMKAAILWNVNEPLLVKDNIKIPELLSGQVLVKIDYSGVCHSQLMEARGKRGKDVYLPHLLGHEGSGQVVAIGDHVTKVSIGDYVILGWIKGEGKNVPATKYKLGDKIINSGPITTFSTYSVVSENRIVPIPAGLPKDIAVLFGCALPTGAGIIINEVRPDAKSSVVLIGMGGIGLSALFACSFFECDPIIAVDINQNKLDLAKKFGATHIINSIKKDPIVEVLKITNGVGVDISVEAAGKVKTIEMAFEMVRREGGNCVFASHPEANKKICLDPFELISGKRIQGTWGGGSNPDIDIPKIAEYYLNSDFPLELLITKTYNLEQINDALDDLESGKVFRPLIICNQ